MAMAHPFGTTSHGLWSLPLFEMLEAWNQHFAAPRR
jgi:hypothetical protein